LKHLHLKQTNLMIKMVIILCMLTRSSSSNSLTQRAIIPEWTGFQ
jgi:hypothetical protein